MGEKKKAGIFHTSERDGVEYRRVEIWRMIIGMGNNGVNVSFYLLIGFASMVATEGYGILVAAAGAILGALRIFDGIDDPIAAILYERINPKHGKMRICMVFGWALSSFGAVLLFSWASGKFEGAAGVAMFLVAYIVFELGYTINGVGGGTVSVTLINDPTQRPMIDFVGTIYSYLVPMLYTNLTTFVILPKHDNQYNAAMLSDMVWMYVIISGVFLILACIGVSKVDNEKTFTNMDLATGKKKEKVTLKDMWSVLRGNHNLHMYMITGITDKLAQQTSSYSLVMTVVNGVLIGSYAASQWASNVSNIVGLIFAFAGGLFIAKTGAKKGTVVWSWISIGVAVFCVVFCLALGGPNGMNKIGTFVVPFVIWTILSLCKTGAQMALNVANNTMKSDVIDYEHERSGMYVPAVVQAAYGLIDKVISSFGSVIASIGLSLVGYVNAVPQLGDKPTWPIFWVGMFLMFGMPILGWICNIISMHFYTLDKERMVQVQKTLSERKNQTKQ